LFIGSFLATGSISYLYYADRLNQLPLGMVGIAVGTALLPMLSRAIAKKNMKEARDMFNRSMEYCLLLALPAGVALGVIPLSIVTALFERGAFTAADSLTTAHVLAGYAVGLPAYIATKVFATTYWARHDTTTPVRVAVIATVFNILASLVFIWFIGVAGIALATGLSGWVQFAFFMREMKKDKVMAFDERFIRHFRKIAASSCVMGIVLLILSTVLQGWLLEGHGLARVLALAGLIGGGGLAYGAMILNTKAIEIKDVKKYLLRRL
jgi:putative peptidoglycan lipid II flippase